MKNVFISDPNPPAKPFKIVAVCVNEYIQMILYKFVHSEILVSCFV